MSEVPAPSMGDLETDRICAELDKASVPHAESRLIRERIADWLSFLDVLIVSPVSERRLATVRSTLTEELSRARAARNETARERDAAIERAEVAEQERDACKAVLLAHEGGGTFAVDALQFAVLAAQQNRQLIRAEKERDCLRADLAICRARLGAIARGEAPKPYCQYTQHTRDAHGAVIAAGMSGTPKELSVALRQLATMVHCDLTGELREPHTLVPLTVSPPKSEEPKPPVIKCDFQLGVVPGGGPCNNQPVWECTCIRCTAEDPFRACNEHRTDVNIRHASVFPNRVVHWVPLEEPALKCNGECYQEPDEDGGTHDTWYRHAACPVHGAQHKNQIGTLFGDEELGSAGDFCSECRYGMQSETIEWGHAAPCLSCGRSYESKSSRLASLRAAARAMTEPGQ